MELNRVNTEFLCCLTVFFSVIQEYRFLRIQMIAADQCLVDIRFRFDLFYLTGKDCPVHMFQEWKLLLCAVQGICRIIGKNIE